MRLFWKILHAVIIIVALAIMFYVTLAPAPSEGADAVPVAWDPPALNTDGTACTNLAGYAVQCWPETGGPTQELAVVGTRVTLALAEPVAYTVRVAAINAAGRRSDWSAPLPLPIPMPPRGVRVGGLTIGLTVTGDGQ